MSRRGPILVPEDCNFGSSGDKKGCYQLSSATASQPSAAHPHPAGTDPGENIRLSLRQLSADSPRPTPLRNAWSIWILSFALWTAFAVFSAAGSRIYWIAAGRQSPAWTLLLTWDFSDAYTWALLTPFIFSFSTRHGFGLRNWKTPFLFHVPAAVLFSAAGALLAAWFTFLLPWSRNHPFAPFRVELVGLFWGNIPRYCLLAAVSQALTYRQQFRERELKSSQLEMQLAHAQLNALKMQIEPHFLFNVLNSIATLARRDGASAERMTLQLADLLRLSLQNIGRHEVPLRQELEFLDCYLRIQQTRFYDRLTVRFDIDPVTLDAAVPHLVLQPLVENAIRHGIAPRLISGRIEVQASKQGQKLLLQVLDNGAGLPHGFNEKSQKGVGLTNTRERLQQLHGDNFEFTCANSPSGGCTVSIVLPFRDVDRADEVNGKGRAHANPNLGR